MNAVLFAIFVGTFLCGVILVLLGRRGRRINQHPQCRWCGFDLEGVYPDHVTCPECGAGLKRDNAVRIGVRKRLGSLIVAGAVLMLLPVAPIGIALYAGATGVSLNEYKPVWLLLFETKGSRPAQSALIAQELLSRMQLKSVDADTAKRIAEFALELQEDSRKTWCEDWGDVIEEARTSKLLSEEEIKRFRKNALVVSFRARAQVRAGDPLPVELTLTESRCGSSTNMTAQLFSAKATLDGRVISRPVFRQNQGGFSAAFMGIAGNTVAERIPVAHWWITGTKSPMGVGGRQVPKACWDYRVPKDAAPGMYTLEVHLSAQVDEMNMNGGIAAAFSNAARANARLLTLKTTLEVLAPGQPEAAPVQLSDEQIEDLHTRLHPGGITAYGNTTPFAGRRTTNFTAVHLTFNVRDLPAPVAYKVFIVINGKEQELGQLVSGTAATGEMLGGWYSGMDENSRMIYASVSRLDLKKTKAADIILRPDANAASRMMDPAPVFGQELVYKNVAITNQSEYFRNAESVEAPDTDDGTEPEADNEPDAPGE